MKNKIQKMIEKVLTDVGLRPDLVTSSIEGILLYYGQEHRHYHTIQHIEKMLDTMEEIGWSTPELAYNVLFHDIFFKTDSVPGSNEQMSQFMAQHFFQTNCVGKFTLYINATAGFLQTQMDVSETAQKLMDLDLSSLAVPSFTLFCKNQELLIREGPSLGSELSTAIFLKKWQEARPDGFYYTAYARTTWGAKAKANIDQYVKLHLPKPRLAEKKPAKKKPAPKKKVTKKKRRK